MRTDLIARLDVGKNVCAAKTVNRLFRVADHKQTTLRMWQINTAENAVLQRVGVLEFVDHRHRIERANARCQCAFIVTIQRCGQLSQQVIERQPLLAGFGFRQQRATVSDRVRQQRRFQGDRLRQKRLHGLKHRMTRRIARWRFLHQHILSKTLQLVRHLVTMGWLRRPVRHRGDPLRQ